jgi:hypothetical protein
MKDRQRRWLAAAKSGKDVLDGNSALWDAAAARASKRSALAAFINTIEGLDAIVTKDNRGFARDKNLKKAEAAAKARKVAKALTVFAKETQNVVLEHEINFERTDLLRVSDEEAAVRWKLVFDRGITHELALIADYGLVAGDVNAVNVARLAFLAAVPGSDHARAARTAAVAMMKTEFTDMRKTIESIKELAAVLHDTEPEFVTSVYAAFKIDDIGKRKVKAIFTYRDFDTSVLLANVVNEVAETGSKKKSTPRGLVQRKSIENGNYKIVSSLKGYEPDVRDNVAFESGVVNRIEIRLKKTVS